mmetsp:Transcript_47598/g.97322  ORF Transcript_47598/g.97322 Transcript_47598/m.97322 type:complete len:159 (+) Transcript_47598:43-519(+)
MSIRLKPQLDLLLVKSIKIVTSPWYDAPAISDFVRRVTTRKVEATNPKCDVKICPVPDTSESFLNPPPPEIHLEFADGSKEMMVGNKKMNAEKLVRFVQDRCYQIKTDQQIAEMLKNPVVGPMPVKIWKGRRQIFVDYAEDENARKKAAGGVKTIKKK